MPTLLLCMTPGISLHIWAKQGILNREIRPYLSLVDDGWKIKILTFNFEKANTYNLPKEIQTIFFPHQRLLFLFPYLYFWLANSVDILKTNQSRGSWHYTQAAHKWKKPILLRCGFVNGEGLESIYGLTKNVISYQAKEEKAFNQATKIETTTNYQAKWIVNKYHIPFEKIEVIPNYIDTLHFKPNTDISKLPFSVISVGTLHPVKRFDLLINACAIADVSCLTILGDGPDKLNLIKLAEKMHVNLILPGRVSNEELPKYLQKSQIFAISSIREGHPKALVEAMACGLCCVGVDVVGIRECLLESQAGILTESNPESIAQAITKLQMNPEMRKELGQNGQNYVNSFLSLPLIFKRKKYLLEQCLFNN